MEDSDDDGVKKDSGFSTDSDDASDDSSDDQDDSNADEDDDDDLLPFEKAAKKTKKKHAKEAWVKLNFYKPIRKILEEFISEVAQKLVVPLEKKPRISSGLENLGSQGI